MKTALILDLDNTIYPVTSIGDKLFAPVLELMSAHRNSLSDADYETAKKEILRKPFQKVAEMCHFSQELTEKGLALLRNASYEGPMEPFEDYQAVRELKIDKFLVTTGFTKLQNNKIRQLGIAGDFRKVYIVDPETTKQTKKDIFQLIMEDFGLKKEDMLVIGDDPDSEIQAAVSLGIDCFLFDPEGRYDETAATLKGASLTQVKELLF